MSENADPIANHFSPWLVPDQGSQHRGMGEAEKGLQLPCGV
jgi:hypothetical protein